MKRKLLSQLRTFKAQWCAFDEMISSIFTKCLKDYPLILWGIEQGLLRSQAKDDRTEIYFNSKTFLEELQQTTCAFTGRTVK